MTPVVISTLGESFLLSNYGTFFQHYALRRILRDLGFIPSRLSHLRDRYERVGFLLSWCMDVAKPVYWMLKGMPAWPMRSRQLKEYDILNFRFLLDYHRLIGPFREPQMFGTEIVGVMGGDQILGAMFERAWLDVVPVGNKCIAYAASSDWEKRKSDKAWQEFAKTQFKRFSAIGIRERAGVGLCKNLVEPSDVVEHVADPVMLLDAQDYERIASRSILFKKPTLFCYLVNIREKDDLRIDEYVRLALMLGCDLKIVGIQGAELLIPSKYRIRLSPTQFLRAMMDATYVVTNSYHGSVFAAIFKKKFLSVWQNCPPGTDQNERQKEFMAQFGLSNRWVDWRLNADQWYDALVEQTNWSDVDGGIKTFRDKSLKWLQRALGA